MRTLNPYLVLIALLFSVISCTVDQEPIIENDSSNFIIETSNSDQVSNQTEQRSVYTQALSPESIELERNMQWVSYITARILHSNAEARESFVNQIQSGPGIVLKPRISINNILGNTIPDSDPFKSAFINNYTHYLAFSLGCVNRPGGTTATPPPGSTPPGTAPTTAAIEFPNNNIILNRNQELEIDCHDPLVMAALVDEFINFIVNNHCLELYFPNGISDIEYDTITSTAHPLTSLLSSNSGYYSYYPSENSTITNIEGVTVDQTYVTNTSDPVVVVRPKKSRRCLYAQFNFDLTDFLE